MAPMFGEMRQALFKRPLVLKFRVIRLNLANVTLPTV